jgi:NAD(P)-dependent dehydrogenase (short-subunit alcohol dehydrogenase family)
MVCPGFTDTEMLRAHINHDEDILTAIACRNGFNRLIRPDEIAEIAYQTALNPVLNGSLIHANLGQRD